MLAQIMQRKYLTLVLFSRECHGKYRHKVFMTTNSMSYLTTCELTDMYIYMYIHTHKIEVHKFFVGEKISIFW